MNKTIIMKRLDDKETKGCYRYGRVSGDEGIETIYVKKQFVSGEAPRQIRITIAEDNF